jgi:hypothetical protein
MIWTRFVVVSELPVTPDTLLLRLLGAGQVLKQAIYQLGRRVIAELRATGALQPYVAHPRLAPGFDARMTALRAFYNH